MGVTPPRLPRRGIAELRLFIEKHGHARVPKLYTAPSGFNLSTWVQRRRQAYQDRELSAGEIAELQALPGWTWTRRDEWWDRGVAEVRRYAAVHGHARIPQSFVTPRNYQLGRWACRRRREYRAGKLSADRIVELELIRGWTWDKREDRWQRGIVELRRFIATRGHALVPSSYKTPTGFDLGSWVFNRRAHYRAGRISAERIAELEAQPGWTWSVRDEQWERGIDELRLFVEEFGHARVPKGYASPSGFNLGGWVRNRRRDHRVQTLSPERIAALEALPGWFWSAAIGENKMAA